MSNSVVRVFRSAALLLLVQAGAFGALAGQATFTVNSILDPGTGVCDVTECTLREAITAANLTGALDSIKFVIASAGPHVITPTSELPDIIQPVLMTATTEPDSVVLDGSSTTGVDGLTVTGGSSTIRNLTIQNFDGAGIALTSSSNIVVGNKLGTDVNGTSAAGNAVGVRVDAGTDNSIGGPNDDDRNIISGNTLYGVYLAGTSSETVVQGTFIGTNLAGGAAVANGSHGVFIEGSDDNEVGLPSGGGNLISGNTGDGVRIDGATGNLVHNNNCIGSNLLNCIGQSLGSPVRLSNANGVHLLGGASNNQIGGPTLGEGNLIVASNDHAVFIENGSNTNFIHGNRIGSYDGVAHGLGNEEDGVRIVASSANRVGGELVAERNRISFQGGAGVTVVSGTGNIIQRNSIYHNAVVNGTFTNHLGIDLAGNDAVNANDSGDGDSGANNLQNFPVLTAAADDGTVSGTLNSAASTEFTLDFFANTTADNAPLPGPYICDASGNGEGETYLASISVMTNGSGNASFSTDVGSLTIGAFVTAVATDPSDNTSEFSACVQVQGGADVVVTKTGPANVAAGGQIVYTLKAKNIGPAAATGVVLQDSLPATVAYVSSSDAGSLSSRTVTWPSVASIAAGDSVMRTVTVTAPATGSLTNIAKATTTSIDPVATNNNGTNGAAQVVTTVTESADIQVTKTGPANVNAGAQIVYTLTVKNLGPSPATGVAIADSLPATVTYVSSSNSGSLNSRTVTWSAVAIAAGDSVQRTVTVTAPATGAFTNIARATATTADPVATNNDGTNAGAQVNTTVTEQADIQVTKTGPANVNSGGQIVYNLKAKNVGPSTATGVVVADSLPATVTYVSSDGGSLSSRTVTWGAASIASGDSVLHTVTVTAPVSGSLTNIARATATTADPVATNNNGTNGPAQVTTTVTEQADVQVTKTGPATVNSGGQIVYNIKAKNVGPSTATGVVVADSLPAAVTYVSSDGGTLAGRTVTWAGASIASGDSVLHTVTVTAPAGGTFTNIARATTTTNDPVPTNNDGTNVGAQVGTTVNQADVAVIKAGPATVNAGGQVVYTLTVVNNGPGTATGVVIADVLPAGVTFVSASDGGTNSSGTVTWPSISINNGQNVQRTVTVTAPGTGTLNNVASATATTTDPNANNNNGTNAAAQVSTTVTEQANVQVAKSGPASVNAGAQIVYTLTITNNGPSTATGVIVSDVLPGAVTFVSASDGGTNSSGTITWPTTSLTNGQSVQRTVTVTAPSTGTLVNQAQSTATTADPDATNNNSSNTAARVTTTVSELADVLVTKTGPPAISANATYTYTVTVTNNGPSTAIGVAITDVLPGAVTFVSASNGGLHSAGTVTWSAVTLTNGQSVQRTVTVTAPATGTLNNVASATATTPDPNANNNNGTNTGAQVTTDVTEVAEVAVSKTGPATVNAAGQIVYTLTVANNGPSTAENVVITDALPNGVTFVSASNGGAHSAGVVTWPTVDINNGASVQRTVTVTAPVTGTLTNVAQSTAATADSDPTNNNGSNAAARVATTVVEQADVQVTKTGPANVNAGAVFTYTLTVVNNGPSTATAVVISDLLPNGAVFSSASSGGTDAGGTVTWPAVNLNNGQSVQRTVTVTAPGAGPLDNVAQATATTVDPDPTNNDGTNAGAQVTTTVNPRADVLVAKTGPATVGAGANFTYTLTVTNNGPSTADGVVITDVLPTAVTFVSASNGGTASAGTVNWPSVSLTNGQAVQRTVTVTAPLAAGTLDNLARSIATTVDPTPGNNNGTNAGARVTTTVTEQADVEVTKAGPATVAAGGTFTYTLTVANHGPSTAANVQIIDLLPAGIGFVSASNGGSASAGTVTWPAVSLTTGQSVPRTVTVTAPSTSGSFTNIASASSTTADPTPSNNNGSNSGARVVTSVESFTVAVAPSSAAAVRGQSASYTVTVAPTGATFGSAVALSCSALPAGAACAFNPTSVTPGAAAATSTLTLSTTAPGTPTGSSNFTVVGTSGVLTQSTAASVNVTKDFQLTVSPATLEVDVGGTAVFSLAVDQSGFFDEQITFACSGLPTGATCAFTPSVLTPNGTDGTVDVSVTASGAASSPGLPGGGTQVPWWAWLSMVLLGLPYGLARAREWWTSEMPPLAHARRRVSMAVVALVLGCLMALGACNSDPTDVPDVTQTFTITGTAGAVARTTTATITVRM